MAHVVEDALQAGREAYARNSWEDAFRLLTEADRAAPLAAEDLEILGQTAWWIGRPEDCIDIRERAFGAYMEAGNRARAAFMALTLGIDYIHKLSHSVAGGWFRKAQQVLENEPESVEHGYFARFRGFRALEFEGRPDLGLEFAQQALEIGTRFGDLDLQALSLTDKGRALIELGRLEEGHQLLDEAMVATVGGDLGPFATGVVYCSMIGAASKAADYRRAGEWEEAARRWCERQSINGFPGVCRVHRAEVMRLRGAWAQAEEEARKASTELREYSMLDFAGDAFYEIGEIRLRMGDLAAADEAFQQANELGRDPHPGLARLRLAQGNVKSAVNAMKRALADAPPDPLSRAKLLPAQVEVALAAKDIDAARSAATELESIAENYGSLAIRAASACANGMVQLAEDDPTVALRSLRQGWHLWGELDAPYEAAAARVSVGEAYLAAGDAEAAALELHAARSAFDRLGAALDARRAGELLDKSGADHAVGATRERRVFMFTDMVNSTAILDAIGDDSWQDLLRWHDETLRGLFHRHGGEEMNKAGDGFFVAFDASKDALECAVSIQHTLADHRRSQGFAPQVRIGLHATEATRTGHEYKGKGVHEAARIGALAVGGEILASEATLGYRIPFPVSEPRTVSLKGISKQVQVRAIDWR